MPDLAHPPPRPPLTRGNTVPLYVRREHSSGPSHEHLRPPPEEPRVFTSVQHRGHPATTGSRQPTSPARLAPTHHWQSGSHPPSLPLSASPDSTESNSDVTYSQQYHPAAHSAHSNPRTAKPHSPYQLSTFQSLAPPMAPSVSMPPVDASSQNFLRSSRVPPPQQHVKMRIESTANDYILSAPLGPGFDPNHITIAARKGNVLAIVADRWDLEKDCHYEWQVQFDRDADMSSIRASYTAGQLEVTVKRIVYPSRDRPLFGRI